MTHLLVKSPFESETSFALSARFFLNAEVDPAVVAHNASSIAKSKFWRNPYIRATVLTNVLCPSALPKNKTGKICGAWNRLPKRYRRQLRRDALLAQLTSADGTILTGKVAKHYGLSSELFSGLLMPEDGNEMLK